MGDDLFGSHKDWVHRRDTQAWVRQAERDNGSREGLTTSEREELKRLQQENSELRKANEILKLASAYFAQAELDRQK